jgi:hypothetical protein
LPSARLSKIAPSALADGKTVRPTKVGGPSRSSQNLCAPRRNQVS